MWAPGTVRGYVPAGLSYQEIQIIQYVGERRERPMPFFLLRLLMRLTLPLLFEYGYQQIHLRTATKDIHDDSSCKVVKNIQNFIVWVERLPLLSRNRNPSTLMFLATACYILTHSLETPIQVVLVPKIFEIQCLKIKSWGHNFFLLLYKALMFRDETREMIFPPAINTPGQAA